MIRKSAICAIAITITAIFAPKSDACTNIIISRGASADGSCMVSYAADSHWLFGELYYHRAADWPAGSILNIRAKIWPTQ